MGEQKVKFVEDPEEREDVMHQILRDIEALKNMLDHDEFETKPQRLGVEQELFLVDKAYRPSPSAVKFLEGVDDERFTTELANFNIEINIDPQEFKNNCFSRLQEELEKALQKARQRAEEIDAQIVITGILPTVRITDLGLKNLTPQSRPKAMIEGMDMLRDTEYPIRINGIDELVTSNFSNMFEGCNTSFQVHYQADPDKIMEQYNFAQLIAAPVLAVCTNSPLLFGKRLWHETRIAMFQQAVETRDTSRHVVEEDIRVPFGTEWLDGDLPDFFRKDVSNYAIFLKNIQPSKSLEELENGKAPQLSALDVFNSSIFRWNRICYGITDDKPHLRIENRLLPAGPTVVDEIANAAFWLGLMNGMPESYEGLPDKMKFDNVRINLLKAARYGINIQLSWLDGQKYNAGDLILEELLPIARNGLKQSGVDAEDIDKYLGIIEERARSLKTGSQWILDEFTKRQNGEPANVSAAFLTAQMVKRQFEETPVHNWETSDPLPRKEIENIYSYVGGIMTTDIYTVSEDDLIDRVANKLFKNGYRHIPVTDEEGKVKGLVDIKAVFRHYYSEVIDKAQSVTVGDVMDPEPVIISPELSLKEALHIMQHQNIKALPVTEDDKLVGFLTEYDIMNFSSYILK